MKIDVVLVLYNRPDHSIAVIDSLIANGVTSIRAFMDHADTDAVAANQERILQALADRPGLEVNLRRHPRRLGLAASVRFALDATLASADAAILLEDDCVVRPGGIEYFRVALTRFKADARVRTVCGYLYPCDFVHEPDTPLLLRRCNTWGWATWRDRWETHNTDLWHAVSELTARKIRVADIAGDLAELCSSVQYLENKVDAWSVPWVLEHYTTGSCALYPPASLIDNIGFDGTGQHCRTTEAFAALPASPPRTLSWDRVEHLPENDDVLRRFMDENGSDIYPET